MSKLSIILRAGFGILLVGVLLLAIMSLFSGHKASGASSEYTASIAQMTEASKKAREALIKDCRSKERVRLLFLLDANSGDTSPTEQEVREVKTRLQENCFFQ